MGDGAGLMQCRAPDVETEVINCFRRSFFLFLCQKLSPETFQVPTFSCIIHTSLPNTSDLCLPLFYCDIIHFPKEGPQTNSWKSILPTSQTGKLCPWLAGGAQVRRSCAPLHPTGTQCCRSAISQHLPICTYTAVC